MASSSDEDDAIRYAIRHCHYQYSGGYKCSKDDGDLGGTLCSVCNGWFCGLHHKFLVETKCCNTIICTYCIVEESERARPYECPNSDCPRNDCPGCDNAIGMDAERCDECNHRLCPEYIGRDDGELCSNEKMDGEGVCKECFRRECEIMRSLCARGQ